MEFHPLRENSTANNNTTTDNNKVANDTTATAEAVVEPAKIYRDCPESILTGNPSPYANFKPYTLPTNPNSIQNPFQLTSSEIENFHKTGILVVPAAKIWTEAELKLLVDSVDLMNTWPDAPGQYMKYYEDSKIETDSVTGKPKKILQRIENFTQYNPGLDYICNGPQLINSCSQLLGEQSILYKEKINYKLPGGAGFVPHQDVAAGWWMYGQSIHISVLVCIDPATIENGCLEVSYAEHNKGMLSAPWTELPPEVSNKLKFVPVPTAPGDVIFFDSYVPHKSEPNNTNKPRRVLYATYAKSSEGDYRARYYSDKRLSFPPDCERLAGKKYEYKV